MKKFSVKYFGNGDFGIVDNYSGLRTAFFISGDKNYAESYLLKLNKKRGIK